MAFSLEQRCKIWLSAAEVTAEQWKLLAGRYLSAEGVWEAFDGEKEQLFPGAQRQALDALRSGDALEAYVRRLEKLRVTVLFQDSGEYPALLREIEDPPYVLYCAGTLSALQKPMVAVIGTRKPSGYGRDMGRRIACGLAEAGVCVVSGLAYGIDGSAHEGALEGQGATVAVLGSGINVPYPQEHIPLLRRVVKSGGLALSEYPLDAKPLPSHFPHRNRLISGMSQALVFVEGKVKSGGMITVAAALAQGREVFAVPGQAGMSGAEGPHTLIREGARLVTCARDVLEDLGLAEGSGDGPPREAAPRSPAQRAIAEALGRESMDVDRLSRETGLAPDALMPELSVMEILGLIRKEAGNLFSLSR